MTRGVLHSRFAVGLASSVVLVGSAHAVANGGDGGQPIVVSGDCAEGLVKVVEGCATPPIRIRDVDPKYPKQARRQSISATVIVTGVVGTDGRYRKVKVVRSTVDGMGFEEAALNAVAKWRYTPGMVEGRPVPVPSTVRVRFHFK